MQKLFKKATKSDLNYNIMLYRDDNVISTFQDLFNNENFNKLNEYKCSFCHYVNQDLIPNLKYDFNCTKFLFT
jgi:hypothetical protein